ncbi:MAG: hypothetical protein V8R11_07625 [Alphaproteobacteria bacterium]
MEITLLKEEDVWGDSALEVIQAYGTRTGISDAAIVLGACRGSRTKDSIGVPSGLAWSASSSEIGLVRTVDLNGSGLGINPNKREAAGRPALLFPATSAIRPNNIKIITLQNGKTVQICEYGAYPQTVAPESISQELEVHYQKNTLKTTGKKYTFDSAEFDAWNIGFALRNSVEYIHKGKKYIRIEGKPFDGDSVLSDGTSVQKGQAYWFEVQPIEWLMDPKGTWVARQALFAGVQFDTKDRYDGNFANTAMYNYLQQYFAKEMQNQFTETLSRLAIRNHYFSNYVSGFENNKDFYPAGKDGQPFTPEKARAIVDITNAPPFMRDLLKLIAAFPKEEQGQFKDAVLTVFDKERDWRDQPSEIVLLGKKLAVSGGYEKELNQVLQGKRNETNYSDTAQNSFTAQKSFDVRMIDFSRKSERR